MSELELYEETVNTDIKSTIFSDGMVVRAEDLDNAMQYPVALFQVMFRAYFGCGIVCGLEVSPHSESENTKAKSCCVKINAGVALDCEGYPLHFCQDKVINLSPEPCPDHIPEKVYLAIKRQTHAEGPRKDSDEHDDVTCKHRWQREQILIKAFEENDLPDGICQTEKVKTEAENKACNCMKTCGDMQCCGESWVLLAIVFFDDDQVCNIKHVDTDSTKYIKPISCNCPPVQKDDPQPQDNPPPKEKPKDEPSTTKSKTDSATSTASTIKSRSTTKKTGK